MLTVAPNLAFRLYAGEPFIVEVQLLDADGKALDVDDHSLVLSVFTASSRTPVSRLVCQRLTDANGNELFRTAQNGTFSEELSTRTGLIVDLSRRFRLGREVVGVGSLTIDRISAPLDDLSSEPIGRVAVRVTAKQASLGQGGGWTITTSYVDYSGGDETPEPDPTPAYKLDFRRPASAAYAGAML